MMQLHPTISVKANKVVQTAGMLFARQGYNGTSTREIARLADVSENSIFRIFSNKEDLFWSVLHSHCTKLKFSRDLQEGIAKCDPPEVVLPKIIELLTDTSTYRPELLRLVAVAILELPWKGEAFCREHFSPVISAIRHYLAMNVKSGIIRDLDPTMLTVALIMTSLTHSGIYNLIEGNGPLNFTSLEAHRAHTRFWLDLITPRMSAYLSPLAQILEESSS
jgi:AcrR family transcriptional regulator